MPTATPSSPARRASTGARPAALDRGAAARDACGLRHRAPGGADRPRRRDVRQAGRHRPAPAETAARGAPARSGRGACRPSRRITPPSAGRWWRRAGPAAASRTPSSGALGWERLAASVEVAAGALGRDEGDGIEEMIGRRSIAAPGRRDPVRGLPLPLAPCGRPHAHRHRPAGRAVPRAAGASCRTGCRPCSCVAPGASRVKAGPDGFDARAYEVAVIVHLRDRLRAGDIWVEGSRAYRRSRITCCRRPPSPPCAPRSGSASRCPTPPRPGSRRAAAAARAS